MYDFIPLGVIVLSLGGILFIVGKKMPIVFKMKEEDVLGDTPGSSFSIPLFSSIPFVDIKKYREPFFRLMEKVLRRSVIFSLKSGNAATRLLQRIKERSEKISIPYLEELTKERTDESFSEKEKGLIERVKKDPKNSDTYKELGYLYFEEGNTRDAKLSFEEALKLDPDDADMREKLESLSEKEESGEADDSAEIRER